jgi:hypothetical protein
MRSRSPRGVESWLLATIGGLLSLVCGCDPTIRATVENGVISLSQTLFGSFITALVQLAGEANQTGT